MRRKFILALIGLTFCCSVFAQASRVVDARFSDNSNIPSERLQAEREYRNRFIQDSIYARIKYKRNDLIDYSVSSPGASVFHLVKDINNLSESNPINFKYENFYESFAVAGNVAYFSADDGIHGNELWRSDGTASGTYLVKDINPGESSSYPIATAVGNKIFFTAIDSSATINQLWVSDGTESGTHLVNIGSSFGPSSLTDVNGTLYFVASSGTNSSYNQLWKSDGTDNGTVLVQDIWVTAYGSSIQNLVEVNGLLFFTAFSQVGTELWRSDGTSSGTFMVKDIDPYSSDFYGPHRLTPYNNKLYFIANDGTGYNLWVSDGTSSGTIKAPDSHGVIVEQFPYFSLPLAIANNALYFWGSTESTGSELYKYDASDTNGVSLVKDITRGPASTMHNLGEIIGVNNTLFFQVITPDNTYELWKSRGKDINTKLVKSFAKNESFYDLFDGNGTLLFTKRDTTYGAELWISDGTSKGTKLLSDIYTGKVSSNPNYFTNCNGRVFFSAAKEKKGEELWSTDGTTSGTVQVKNINQTTTSSSGAGYDACVFLDSLAIFTAYDKEHGSEVWSSDGTPKGTLSIDVIPGEYSSLPYGLFSKNHFVYFSGYDRDDIFNPNAISLYKTDGTASGLQKLADISFFTRNIQVSDNGMVFYETYDYINGNNELWRTDGTPAGTILLSSNVDDNYNLVTIGNTAFFVAMDSATGYELWKTNGKPAGTKLVKDIFPGASSSYPYDLFVFNNELFFGAAESGGLSFLWKSDGTSAGTVKVSEITPKAFDRYNPSTIFCASNNTLYVVASNFTYGQELWKTDGSEAGTTLVKDIFPGYQTSDVKNLTNVNGTLYFSAYDGVNGYELWLTDGTEAGTKMVKDITKGAGSSNLADFCSAAGKLFFTKDQLLWESDGTRAGTKRIVDAGLNGVSWVKNLKAIGNKLFFVGYSYQYGSELYVGDASAVSFSLTNKTNNRLSIAASSFDAMLYPNPAKTITTLQLNKVSDNVVVTLLDMNGKILWNNNYSGKNAITIPTQKLLPGLYIVSVKMGEDVKNLKLVKE